MIHWAEKVHRKYCHLPFSRYEASVNLNCHGLKFTSSYEIANLQVSHTADWRTWKLATENRDFWYKGIESVQDTNCAKIIFVISKWGLNFPVYTGINSVQKSKTNPQDGRVPNMATKQLKLRPLRHLFPEELKIKENM